MTPYPSNFTLADKLGHCSTVCMLPQGRLFLLNTFVLILFEYLSLWFIPISSVLPSHHCPPLFVLLVQTLLSCLHPQQKQKKEKQKKNIAVVIQFIAIKILGCLYLSTFFSMNDWKMYRQRFLTPPLLLGILFLYSVLLSLSSSPLPPSRSSRLALVRCTDLAIYSKL